MKYQVVKPIALLAKLVRVMNSTELSDRLE
jgi:hypothetical protein